MTEQEVVTLMESCQSSQEWDANADRVRRACGGYPPFWFKAVIQSGLGPRVASRWNDPGLTVETYGPRG